MPTSKLSPAWRNRGRLTRHPHLHVSSPAGVSFSTGRPVDASDVVFSLERLRDPFVVSSGGWILDAVVPDGIRAVDDTTVAIS